MGITDEMLMAYADGELSAAEAAEVERAMAADEALAARVALFADSKAAVRRAFAAPQPVSASLEARIRAMAETDAAQRQSQVPQSNVIDLAARRRVVPFWQMPAAAAVALVIGAGSMWLVTQDGRGAGGLEVAGLSDPAIIDALGKVPSGERVALGEGTEFAAIATFQGGEGELCREFEHDRAGGATVVAVACHADQRWDVRFAIAAAAADAEGYAPASSLDTLDAYLSATDAGAPLSAEDEAAALGALD
ncbi:zf-HC2 domain-containing protein [Tabrizicola sp.]|uniref:zf-HC2 domain-containing protein n=1 Tax=Tabrizicola sp. TaxID=2005166 RepID=UPI003F384BBD